MICCYTENEAGRFLYETLKIAYHWRKDESTMDVLTKMLRQGLALNDELQCILCQAWIHSFKTCCQKKSIKHRINYRKYIQACSRNHLCQHDFWLRHRMFFFVALPDCSMLRKLNINDSILGNSIQEIYVIHERLSSWVNKMSCHCKYKSSSAFATTCVSPAAILIIFVWVNLQTSI